MGIKRAKIMIPYADLEDSITEGEALDIKIVAGYTDDDKRTVVFILQGDDLPVDDYVEGTEAPFIW